MPKAATQTKEKPARKPRSDKGKKHAPGGGKPAGKAAPDPALRARMDNVDKWLAANATCIKPQGIAGKAGITGPDLCKLRTGGKLTETKVAAIEKAAKEFKYNPQHPY